jgi:tetratricopeptide (TPR) repeat protein
MANYHPSTRLVRPRMRCPLVVSVVVAIAGLLLPLPALGQAVVHDHDDIGVVEFNVSCAPEARARFDHALGMLHHMMYQESRQEFEAILEDHPGCGMAHWGVAMTLFQPLWPARPGVEARQRGWQATQRAKQHAGLTDRERALVAAAEAFFQDPEEHEWWPRIRRWGDALEQAYQQRPEDTETAVLYALSRLAVGQVAGDRGAYHAQAAGILQEVHERHPRHPGAIHYTIHANDMTGRVGESLEVVRLYDGIAPSVPHALHMPSHIFVRTGDWPEVIDWNTRSAEAALRFPAGDRVSLHYSHAQDYLLYSYLQRGEDAKARDVVEAVLSRGPHQEDFAAAFHLAVIPARYAVERRAWGDAAAIEPRSPDYFAWDGYWWAEALSWFARGLGAVHTGELDAAREADARMRDLRDRADRAGEDAFSTYIEMDRLILSGWLAQMEGDTAQAVARVREAAALEQTVEKHVITPGALLPPNEALGDLLMQQARPREALDAYDASLRMWPNRFNSLLGAARAARAAGDSERAHHFYGLLLETTDGAETNRPGVREAREFSAG